MAITGSQPSYMYALGGYARGGATRGGDTDPQTYITIAGVHVGARPAVDAQHVMDGSLSIVETEGDTPNTASFQVMGFQPTDGQEVVITQGSKNNLDRLFAGTILTDAHGYIGTPGNYNETIHAIDYTWQLTRDTFSQRWQNTSATTIAQDIIAKVAGRGITSLSVAAGLPVIDEFSVTNNTPAQAMTALAARVGGYWRVLYRSNVAGARADVRFGITTDTGNTDPTVLTLASAALTYMEHFSVTRDLSPVITRQPVEGGGGNALTDTPAGETILPVTLTDWYNPAGGIVVSGPQRLTYSGIQPGGGGSVVGPAVAPSVAIAAALQAGAGIESGLHRYSYLWHTASGETLPASAILVTTGPLATPAATPTATVGAGAGPDPGTHFFAYTATDSAGGETPASPTSAAVVTRDISAPGAPGVSLTESNGCIITSPGNTFDVVCTYTGSSGGETTASGATTVVTAACSFNGTQSKDLQISLTAAPPADGVSSIRVYIQKNGTGYRFFNSYGNFNQSVLGGFAAQNIAGPGLAPPGSNTCFFRRVTLTGMTALQSGQAGYKFYGTVAGGSQLKLAGTSASISTADGSLGANVPVTNTTQLNQVNLSGIALGPTGTTERWVYRSAAGQTQLKLLLKILNNTATTATDTAADATLGANAPTGDTSALSTVTGTIVIGATSILTAGTSPFPVGGGWVRVGQQFIRFTGISGNTLTGIPTAGIGAIISIIAYGEHIDPVPALTGIPASGAGAILYLIKQGDPINLRVVIDDVIAQAALASLMLPTVDDGVIEGAVIQDGRISETEARARGAAQLLLRSLIDVAIAYDTRDKNTHASRTAGVNLPAPTNVVGSFRLQTVTIDTFTPAQWPIAHAHGASKRNTLEDFLRRARGA